MGTKVVIVSKWKKQTGYKGKDRKNRKLKRKKKKQKKRKSGEQNGRDFWFV